MRELAAPVPIERDDLLDTAGTGGGRSSFNVSTTAALIAAGAGCAVAKHGNRSATSRSGSADLLEALGARIDLGPEEVAECIREAGFGFMFAPAHHQATRYVIPVRRELAVRTIFNLLGPLTNPAGARRQLIGVSDPSFLETMAGALALLGSTARSSSAPRTASTRSRRRAPRASSRSTGAELADYVLTPEDAGSGRARGEPPAGGTPEENAAVTERSCACDGRPDARRRRGARADQRRRGDLRRRRGADTIADGVQAARAALADGRAAEALSRYVRPRTARPAEARGERRRRAGDAPPRPRAQPSLDVRSWPARDRDARAAASRRPRRPAPGPAAGRRASGHASSPRCEPRASA